MSKGFVWICQNNDKTDYVELSVALAKSIKRHNKESAVCVITDSKTKINAKEIDIVKVMDEDDSEQHDIKWGNEYKAFFMSPFTHSIKLAADMLWTTNTDWWWNYLWQHNMVFSIDCYNYKNQIVQKKTYRPFHDLNQLQNIYSDLTYFRRSSQTVHFGKLCQALSKNWEFTRDNILRRCHDKYPSTDVIYALAQRLMDPINQSLVNFPWFKIIHNKKNINDLDFVANNDNYLMPINADGKIIHGGHVLTRPLHYVNKNYLEDLNARIF
jgi:hypothetical protein